jgi:hypothetical protein
MIIHFNDFNPQASDNFSRKNEGYHEKFAKLFCVWCNNMFNGFVQ